MRRSFPSPLLLLPLFLSTLDLLVAAIRIPFHVHTPSGHTHPRTLPRTVRRLAARAASASTSSGAPAASTAPTPTMATNGIPVTNVNNVEYLANITLNGAPFTVILDTGSADLWVAGSVPNAQDLGKSVSLSYAIGTANGNVHTAALTLDSFSVSNQAFVLVTDTSTFSSDFQHAAYQGLLGLGPNTGSVIYRKVDASDNTADSTVFRIFEANKTSQSYITLFLNRVGSGAPTGANVPAGQFTISELVPGYEAVTSQTKLTIKDVPTLTDADQHWAVLSDAWGLTGPDGQPVQVGSSVPRVSDEKLVAVLDSGFTFSQVPRAMADAIYGRVQGAWYDTAGELWRLPCAQELNITFHFGGSNFPVHPLDTSSSDITTTVNGQKYCTGTFQPITTAFSLLGEYDVILGMSFLRNAYTLIDFGDFVKGGGDSADPFIQLLPITDPATAHAQFVAARLGGVDTTGSPAQTLLPPAQESHSPESAGEKKAHREQAVLKYWPYILVGCLAFLVISLVACCYACCMRRRRRRLARETERAVGLPLGRTKGAGPYHNLAEPSPLGGFRTEAMISSESMYTPEGYYKH